MCGLVCFTYVLCSYVVPNTYVLVILMRCTFAGYDFHKIQVVKLKNKNVNAHPIQNFSKRLNSILDGIESGNRFDLKLS